MTEQIREDAVIDEFLKSIGPWSNCIVIGGGYALIIYRLYLANNNGILPVGTRDIDSLISRKAPKVLGKNIGECLQEAGFLQSFKDYDNPATESYIKEINGVEVEVEFLTNDCTRKGKNKNIAIAGTGIIAKQLSYIQMSLDNIKKFKTFSGILGQVASPAAWMFHKGLAFPKRNDKKKSYKDLYGIWYVATQLGDLSQEAVKELASLSIQHPQWSKTFCKNLQKWLDIVIPYDWINLESQDPYGNLKKEAFEDLVTVLKKACIRI
jgi:hypothetical protein